VTEIFLNILGFLIGITFRAYRSLRANCVRLYVHFFVQSSSTAKCPCCGVRAEHKMQWAEVLEKLMHVCARCHAAWAESPLVDAAKWKTQLEVAEGQPDADGNKNTTVMHAQREPKVVNEVKLTGNNKPIVMRMAQRG
jgi:hypothetical protein